MNPRFLNSIGIGTTLIIVGLGIFSLTQSYHATTRPVDIRIVASSWPTSRLLYAAQYKGFFDRRGIHVSIVDAGDSYPEAQQIIMENRADGGAFVLSEPLLLTAGHVPMKVVLNTDYSAGADGIVATSDIKRVADLKGKTVAFESESYGHLLLEEALLSAGLTESDIIPVPTTTHKAAQLFLQRGADAVVTLEPFLSQAASRSDGHIIYSSREAPGLLPDVVAFRADFVSTHEREVQAFVGAWFDMISYMNESEENQKEMLAIVAIKNKVSLKDLRAQFEGIHLFTFADNAASFTYGDDTASLYGAGKRFVNFFHSKGMVAQPIDLEHVIEPRFIRSGLK